MADYRQSNKPGAIRMREKAPEYAAKYRAKSAAKQAHRARQALRRSQKKGELVSIRELLFDHDGLCHLCGGPINGPEQAEIDHILPLSKGGPHTRDNLAPAHRRCNRIKRGLTESEVPAHILRLLHEELLKHCPPPNWPMIEP